MKKERMNVVTCLPCGERACPRGLLSGGALATKRGAYKTISLMSPSIGPADHFLRKGGSMGFTLIELLVVVLIIGILAAVAVPQYKMTVEKNHAVQGIVLARALHDAQESYYLENGQYASSKNNLTVDITCPPDYTCTVNKQCIRVQYKNAPWYIQYSHNYRNDNESYTAGKLSCWQSSNLGKSICDKLGKAWYRVDTNHRLIN